MKTYPECIPCFINQGLNAVSRLGLPPHIKKEIAVRSLKVISSFNSFDRSPAYYAYFVQLVVKEVTGVEDPFYTLKREANKKALEIYESILKMKPRNMEDIDWALKLSAVGNAIDFAIKGEFDLKSEIERLISREFSVYHGDIFKEKLAKAESVLIVGDNAGEIVFDRFLVEVLKGMGLDVTYGVKGKPILNDALMEDAVESGMADICKVIDNGSDKIGTWLDDCKPEFVEVFNTSDIIISKGQANFETLNDIRNKDIFFLLQAKCDPIGFENGSKKGSLIFRYNFG